MKLNDPDYIVKAVLDARRSARIYCDSKHGCMAWGKYVFQYEKHYLPHDIYVFKRLSTGDVYEYHGHNDWQSNLALEWAVEQAVKRDLGYSFVTDNRS